MASFASETVAYLLSTPVRLQNKDSARVIKVDTTAGNFIHWYGSTFRYTTLAMSAQSATTGQVLEFKLGEETYCVSIDYVTEIVDIGELTQVPNAPPYVEGVMDLRGRTTAIVDPKAVFGIDEGGEGKRIIVFDPAIIEDQNAAGWLVDEVYQVVQIDAEQVDRSPANDAGSIRGVVKREGENFVIWVDPAVVHSRG